MAVRQPTPGKLPRMSPLGTFIFCRAQSGQDDRGEYFNGIDFAQVVAFAGTLAYGTRQAIPSALVQPGEEGSDCPRRLGAGALDR